MHVYFGELAVIFQVHLKDMGTVVAQEGRVGCLSTERLRVRRLAPPYYMLKCP